MCKCAFPFFLILPSSDFQINSKNLLKSFLRRFTKNRGSFYLSRHPHRFTDARAKPIRRRLSLVDNFLPICDFFRGERTQNTTPQTPFKSHQSGQPSLMPDGWGVTQPLIPRAVGMALKNTGSAVSSRGAFSLDDTAESRVKMSVPDARFHQKNQILRNRI